MHMKRAKNVNLLTGSPAKSLAALTLPVIGASFIQMLYNFTDLFWISSLGSNALAAVGTGGTFLWFTEGFMIFARMGGQILTGQAYGRGDEEDRKRVAAASLQLGIGLALLVCLSLTVFHKPLIAFFRFQSAETIAYAEIYLLIVALGVPFNFMTRILSGLLAACGNTKTAFTATMIGLICNILLDPLFIFAFRLGVSGAALATVIAQALVFTLLALGTKQCGLFSNLNLRRREPLSCYLGILKLGVPSGLQTMLYAGISIVLGRIVAGFGDLQVAVQRVSGQIESITWTVADAFAVSVNAFIAQNLAAGQRERLRSGYRAALAMTAAVGLLGMTLMVVFPNQIGGLFFKPGAELAAARDYLVIVGFSEIFMVVELMTSGAFAGIGNTVYPSVVVSALTALRLPLALILSQGKLGVKGVWWAIGISSILKGITLFISFEIRLKQEDRLLKS